MIFYLGGCVINYSENKPRKQWNKETPQTLMNILSNADVSLAFKTYTIYKPGKSPVCEQTFLQTVLLIETFCCFFFLTYICPVYRDCALEFVSQEDCFGSFFKVCQMKCGITKIQAENSWVTVHLHCISLWRTSSCSSVAEWGCDKNAAAAEPCVLHPPQWPAGCLREVQ